MGLHTSGLQRIGDSAGCLAVARLHTRSHMFAMLAALLLNLAPAAASSSPPLLQAPSSNARSASLLASETASLERKVARQSSLLAAWLPLVVGLGAGPLASGVGYWLMTSITGYRHYRAGQGSDTDYNAVDILYRTPDDNVYRQFNTFTQELRFK